MKLKEIEVGMDYAWGNGGVVGRVRVLEKGPIRRRVYSGYRSDFGGHISTSPAVRVQRLHENGEPAVSFRNLPLEDVVVTPSQIVGPWETYAAARSQAQSREAQARETENALQSRMAAHGFRVAVTDGKATLGLQTLSNLLDKLDGGV